MRFQKLLITLAAASGMLALSTHSVAARLECLAQNMTGKVPKWVSSLEYNNGKVLIADPTSNTLFSFDPSAWRVREERVPGTVPLTSITKIQGGFLVKHRDDAAIISPTYKLIRDKFNPRATKSGVSGLGSLYANWVTRGSTFVGFGSVGNFNAGSTQYNPSRRFELGFIKGEVSASSREFRNIQLLEATEETDFYLLGFPYFAATDDGIFFVKMTRPRASIVRVREYPLGRAGIEELKAFPSDEDLRSIPPLESRSLPGASVDDLFEEIEKTKMIVGLFGQGRMLYVLARQPAVEFRGTEWLLYQIDPHEDKLLGAVRLPTTANHLSVAIGPEFWYLFERGPVRGWGQQDFGKVIKVPSQWIGDPARSPLNTSNPLRSCKPPSPRP